MLWRALKRRPHWAALLCGLLALLTLGGESLPLRLVMSEWLKLESAQRLEEDERGEESKEESKAVTFQTADRRHGRTRIRIWPTTGLLSPKFLSLPPHLSVSRPIPPFNPSPHKRNSLGITLRC
jgi:hypothetical protein